MLQEVQKAVIKRQCTNEENITEEMEKDIRNGISAEDYAKKYNLSKSSFYNHIQAVFPELVKK